MSLSFPPFIPISLHPFGHHLSVSTSPVHSTNKTVAKCLQGKAVFCSTCLLLYWNGKHGIIPPFHFTSLLLFSSLFCVLFDLLLFSIQILSYLCNFFFIPAFICAFSPPLSLYSDHPFFFKNPFLYSFLVPPTPIVSFFHL